MSLSLVRIRFRYWTASGAAGIQRLFSAVGGGGSRFLGPSTILLLGLWLLEQNATGHSKWLLRLLLIGVVDGLALYLVVLVLRWGNRLRHTTVFEEFKDETGLGISGYAKSLTVRVPIEYERLRGLHREAADEAPDARSVGDEHYRSTLATVKADDVSDFLESAFASGGSLEVGSFLRLPLEAVGRIAARMVRGPRITGTLLRSDDGLQIVAQLIGGKSSANWQVTAPVGDVPTADLVHELAARIFTSARAGDSSSWQTTSAFCAGMAAYRRSLEAGRGSELGRVHLEDAETEFLRALRYDRNFALAHYNFGIVCASLRRYEAARGAYLRAIKLDSYALAPYYALARLRYFYLGEHASGPLELALRVARVSKINEEKAAAHDLAALLTRAQSGPDHPHSIDHSIYHREQAAKHAFRALRRARLRPGLGSGTGSRQRELAATCTFNLAVTYVAKAQELAASGSGSRLAAVRRWREVRSLGRRAHTLYDQSLALSSRDAEIHTETGRLYEWQGAAKQAEQQFERAANAAPEQPRYAAQLAAWAARKHTASPSPRSEALVRARCAEAVYSPERVFQDALFKSQILENLSDAYDAIGDVESARRVRQMPAVRRSVENCGTQRDIRALTQLSKKYRRAGAEWAEARALYRLGTVYWTREPPLTDDALVCFDRAKALLEPRHAGDVKELGLLAWIARAYRQMGRLDVALVRAESAVEVDPANSFERLELGEVHFARSEWAEAKEASEGALLLAPDNVRAHWIAGRSWWYLAEASLRKSRRVSWSSAQDHFDKALMLSGPTGRLQAHYWLGRVAARLGDDLTAAEHFQGAYELEGAEPLTLLYCGQAYERLEMHDHAIACLDACLASSTSFADGDLVGKVVGEQIPVPAVRAWARCGIAESLADRGVEPHRALEALKIAQRDSRACDSQDQVELLAAIACCRGRIFMQLSKLPDAIRAFQHASALRQSWEAHYRLALCYEAQLPPDDHAPAPWSTVSQLRFHLEVARALAAEDGPDSDSSRRIDSLERRTARLTPTAAGNGGIG